MNRRLLQLGLAATIALIFVPAASAAHHHRGHDVSPPAGGCAADVVAPTIVKGHHHKPEVAGRRGKGGKGTQPPATTPCPPTVGGTSGDGSPGDGSSSPGNGGIIGTDDGQPDGGNGLGGDGLLGGLGGGDGFGGGDGPPGGYLGNGFVVTDNFDLSGLDGSLGSNGDYLAPSSPTVAAAPEPSTLALLGLAFCALTLTRRARQPAKIAA